jgi:hypothetical protein
VYKKEHVFLILLIIGFLILVSLGIHGSSIGMYHRVFAGNAEDPSLIFGVPRGIRSDEWGMGTPLQISQMHTGFSPQNDLIGTEGQNVAFMNSAPVKHWTNFFDIFDLGFFLFNIEQGHSFRWLSKGLLLLAAAYLLMMKLTGRNILISIGFAFTVLFNPFMQWWYSTTAVETAGYGFLILYLLIKVFEYKNWRNLAVSSVLLIYFLIAFGFNLYPPFQVPIAVGCVFFFAGYVLDNRKTAGKEKIIPYAVAASGVLFFVMLGMYRYLVDFKSIIDIMQNTAYPGRRVVPGGDYSLLAIFSNIYSIKLQLSSGAVPPIWGNQCEAARFLDFPFFSLPVAFYWSLKKYFSEKKIDWVLVCVALYVILCGVWMFAGLHPFLAKITFLYMVPTNRMLIGLGSFNLLLMFYLLGKTEYRNSRTLDYKIFIIILALVYFAVNLYTGKILKINFPTYLSASYQILGASGLFALIFLLWGLLKEKLFLSLFILTSFFYSGAVNPVYRGLDPLIGSKLSRTVQDITKKDPSSLWVFYDAFYMANFLRANGARTINGTHTYPQFGMWARFDPEFKHKDIYNRYAHVQISHTKDESLIDLKSPQGDVVNVSISPCNKVLKDLGVNYFLFTFPVEDSCLKLLDTQAYHFATIYIYTRR